VNGASRSTNPSAAAYALCGYAVRMALVPSAAEGLILQEQEVFVERSVHLGARFPPLTSVGCQFTGTESSAGSCPVDSLRRHQDVLIQPKSVATVTQCG
jgi:hypothetical protein